MGSRGQSGSQTTLTSDSALEYRCDFPLVAEGFQEGEEVERERGCVRLAALAVY